jgi:hypothetical protein
VDNLAATLKGKPIMFDFALYPRFENKQAIEKKIAQVHKITTGLRPTMHCILVCALEHALVNGDTTLISKFYNGLGNETNKAKGIALWLKEFTNLRYSTAKDGTEQWLKPKKEPAILVKVGYDSTPFYEMPEVDKKNKPFELLKALEALVKRGIEHEADLKAEEKPLLAAIEGLLKRPNAKKKPNDTEIPFEAIAV